MHHCHGNGECIFRKSKWQCDCNVGWEGDDCNHRTELQCDDGVDNDEDGLVDCEEPECCLSSICQEKQLCTSVPTPLFNDTCGKNVEFWNRVKFLIGLEGIQRYAPETSFDKKFVCVARGRVITKHGRGLPGVRISREGFFLEGFTLSRPDGYFDFLANCKDGRITLKFGKRPYPFQTRAFNVIANQVRFLSVFFVFLFLYTEPTSRSMFWSHSA